MPREKGCGDGLKSDIIYKKNDNRYKQIYQDYDWAFEQYVTKRKSYPEIADELNVSLRVIQKWFSERHKLNRATIKHLLKINNIQSDLIIGSLLGDGHIDRREEQPMFIVSHAENQKDYLYWKYDILKNLCNKPPVVHDGYVGYIKGKKYECKKQYKINTKIVSELKRYRGMSIKELIDRLNKFSLSVFMLDDANCYTSLWSLCVAKFTESDKSFFVKVLDERFGLYPKLVKHDNRYFSFNRHDSDKLAKIITDSVPNNLDIVKNKIIYNKTNRVSQKSQYVVLSNGGEMSVSKYFKLSNKYCSHQYKDVRRHLLGAGKSHIKECEITGILGY